MCEGICRKGNCKNAVLYGTFLIMEKSKRIAKSQAFRESLMKDMTPDERARFLRQIEVADKIMDEEYEVLSRLAKS